MIRLVLREAPFLVIALTYAASLALGGVPKSGLAAAVAVPVFAWLFGVMLWAAFGVVRHADALAEHLGEPYGTLILTLSVIGIEVALIGAMMLTGEANPTLARDTMFAVLMIVLNGLAGTALLVGGLAHREQTYNLQGATAFLAVLIPLSVFALVLPRYTQGTEDPTFTPLQAGFFALVTILLYGVFLSIQTVRHRGFFDEPPVAADRRGTGEELGHEHDDHGPVRGIGYHGAFLLLTLVPIVLLSKDLATLVDYGIGEVGAPVALGGVMIALIVLAPEGLAALRAARRNQLQRSVNLLLGSALATIGLTVPAVLTIGLITGQKVVLGIGDTGLVILVLSLFVAAITFGGARTNLLQGAVHLVIFLAYVLLIFSP